MTERCRGLRDHKEFEFSEAAIRGQLEKKRGMIIKKKTNQIGMQIFGHNGIKGALKQKG